MTAALELRVADLESEATQSRNQRVRDRANFEHTTNKLDTVGAEWREMRRDIAEIKELLLAVSDGLGAVQRQQNMQGEAIADLKDDVAQILELLRTRPV